MSDDAATEWLTVAANEVLGFAEQRPDKFRSACATARRECTYHGQIVPKVMGLARYEWERPDMVLLSADQQRAQQARQQIVEHRGEMKRIGDVAKRLGFDG